jgi:hypothetical protein
MTERDASYYVPRSLVHQLSLAHAEIERLREYKAAADYYIGRLECSLAGKPVTDLVESEGHYLTWRGRVNEQSTETNVMRAARLAAEEVATWSPERKAHAERIVNRGAFGQPTEGK